MRGTDRVSPYAAPARATDLAGLPPALVTAYEFDALRDEDIAYAQRLLSAGVPTELHVYAGAFHACTWLVERRDLPDRSSATSSTRCGAGCTRRRLRLARGGVSR